jgi:hypothetical protein
MVQARNAAGSAWRTCSRNAWYAPSVMLAVPTTTSTGVHAGAAPKIGWRRPRRNTPAFTIVAAWR